MVATAEQTVTFVRVLRELDAADRPMKVFASLWQARAWLKLQRR
jgi:hypothetical protein